jgi:hypothetical protein
VITESIPASLNDSKEHGSTANKIASFTVAALFATVSGNLKLLLLGPAVVGLVTFGIVSALPPWYTSVAYLKIDEADARTADALMHSTPVLDKVLSEFKAPQDTLVARRAFLDANRRIVVAPGEIQMTANLHRLEYSDRDPHVAQRVNSLFIDAWLDSAKLTSEMRMKTEAQIARRELEAKSVSEFLDRLQRDPSTPVSQSSDALEMINNRDKNLAAIINLRSSLNVSREMVFSVPDLPGGPTWPKKGMITILAGFVTGLLLLMFVILRRFWRVRT